MKEGTRVWWFATLISVMVFTTTAQAESTSEVLKVFGLVGVWSTDCSKEAHANRSNRTIYEAPSSSSPTLTTALVTDDGSVLIMYKYKITSAVRIADDKIKISDEQIEFEVTPHRDVVSLPKRESVLVREGSKIRTLESYSLDHTTTLVEEGYICPIDNQGRQIFGKCPRVEKTEWAEKCLK
jgi:hypothetical protein